ncbi:unnamed protein product [Plutella xylostella]|uniref:(diamondback moth) hypothetical protein n=1 Tax=Plutella xylostella TaxID=51655 RepID=A0A8S4GEL1_PLUXY|nr:unnamed protein product [Plutella xylostella]
MDHKCPAGASRDQYSRRPRPALSPPAPYSSTLLVQRIKRLTNVTGEPTNRVYLMKTVEDAPPTVGDDLQIFTFPSRSVLIAVITQRRPTSGGHGRVAGCDTRMAPTATAGRGCGHIGA